MIKKLSYLFCASLLVAACGGGDDDGDDNGGTPDGSVSIPDAAPMVDAAPTCSVSSNLTVTSTEQNSAALLVAASGANPERYIWNYITGNGTQGTDEFFQFRVNKPVTLNTPLQMSQGCMQGSAFCWVLLGNFTAPNNQLDGDVHFPLEGTVTITEAGAVGGRFKATFAGVKFTHFIEGQGGLVNANDNCGVTVVDGTVDLPVAAPQKPGMFVTELEALAYTGERPVLP
jgi:hypothetical protein